MLKIRLSRTGKKGQPSFRILVQEHAKAVKGGKFVEIVGHYHPATPNKDLVIKKDRIEHWLSNGAQPSDTVATLLKKEGFKGMEKFVEPRNKKAKRKKGEKEAPAAPAAAAPAAPAPAVEEAPAEETAPVEEAPAAEEAPAEQSE